MKTAARSSGLPKRWAPDRLRSRSPSYPYSPPPRGATRATRGKTPPCRSFSHGGNGRSRQRRADDHTLPEFKSQVKESDENSHLVDHEFGPEERSDRRGGGTGSSAPLSVLLPEEGMGTE